MRTYELMFIVDPRVSDEEVVALTQDYRQMLENGGAQISKEENWGRRKLAYPIEKLTEGKYVLFFMTTEDGKSSIPEVEFRMRQNDKVLRYLTVRTDEEMKRAVRRGRLKPAEATAGEEPAGSSEEAPGEEEES